MRRKQVDHATVAAGCRANPGQWEKVGEYGSVESADAMVRAIRGALRKSKQPSVYAPAGAFEARREPTRYGARVEARFVGEPVKDVEIAVRELGSLPVPAGDYIGLTAKQRTTIAEQLGDVRPATPGLLVAFGESVRNRREHAHPTWEDLYCMNLSSYMGERMAPVLRRLLDLEDEVEQLRTPSPDRLTRTFAPTQVLREEDRAEVPALTIYRVFWDTLPLGQYTREAEARKHCEAHARRDLPTAVFDWIEDEEDGIAELVAAIGQDERSTGYVVDALEIASEYNPEADE